MLDYFSKWIIRYRWFLLILITTITVVLLFYTTHLTVNNDNDTWLPSNDKVTNLFQEVDKVFSSNAVLFVVLDFSKNSVFHSESLALVQQMTQALEGIREIFNVTSLTNIVDIRETESGIEVGELIPDIPQNEDELTKLKEYVLSNEMYLNSVISSDANYTVVVANINPQYDEVKVAQIVLDKVRENARDTPYYFGGDPAIAFYLDQYMNEDLSKLSPLMLVIMFLILWIGFRSFLGVILPVGIVTLVILWTLGLQALFNIPANVLTPAVVVLLIAMGSDYAVYIYNHFLKCRDVRISSKETTLPLMMAAITTIAGLLSFSTTKIDVLKFFGIELALGIGVAFFLSVILMPVFIYIFKANPLKNKRDSKDNNHFLSNILKQIGGWTYNHAIIMLLLVSFGLFIMGFGLFRVSTKVDYVAMLPKLSPPSQGHNILTEHFSGIYPLSIYFRGNMEDPAVLNRQNMIENFLRSEDMLSNFISISSLIAEANWLINGIYAVPDTEEEVANLWILLEGQETINSFVTTDRKKSLITSMVKEYSTGGMAGISHNIKKFLEGNISHNIVEIELQNLPPEGQEIIKSLMLDETLQQLSWLAHGYDKSNIFTPALFKSRIEKGYAEATNGINLEPVWKEVEWYLKEETVKILPQNLIDQLLVRIKDNWHNRKQPNFRKQLEKLITAAGVTDKEDKEILIAGILKRGEFKFRLQQVAMVEASYQEILPPDLKKNKNFNKRAGGVLWGLFNDHPFFFKKVVNSIPGIDEAVKRTTEVDIDLSGMTELYRKFDELLIQSQFQSLFLASFIVFVFISVSLRSIKRGIISLLTILVPLELIMGLMGWMGIPLDFGTVLCGALIIGLGVDGSIHFLHYYHHLANQVIKDETILQSTIGHVGKGILIANAATCCGFFVLMLSKISAVRNFAFINVMAILMVTASILTILPALVSLFGLTNDKTSKELPIWN